MHSIKLGTVQRKNTQARDEIFISIELIYRELNRNEAKAGYKETTSALNLLSI